MPVCILLHRPASELLTLCLPGQFLSKLTKPELFFLWSIVSQLLSMSWLLPRPP